MALDQREPVSAPVAAASDTRVALITAAYERYGRTLYGFIRRIIADASDAEDILQDCFARALTSCHADPALGEDEALRHCRRWLFQVATHLCIDLLRRRKRHPWQFWQTLTAGPDGAGEGDPESARTLLHPVEPGPSLSDRVERRLLICDVFRRLAPGDVSVLLLSDHCGFTLAEIGTMLDCSPAAAAKKVARARERFVRCYRYVAREEDAP